MSSESTSLQMSSQEKQNEETGKEEDGLGRRANRGGEVKVEPAKTKASKGNLLTKVGNTLQSDQGTNEECMSN